MSINESKIMKAVGKPVKMKYPGSEGTRRGILKSREIALNDPGHTGALYCVVVDIIRFDDTPEPCLRVGYYRQPKGVTFPRWASQTTWCGTLSQWRKVLPTLTKSMEKADALKT